MHGVFFGANIQIGQVYRFSVLLIGSDEETKCVVLPNARVDLDTIIDPVGFAFPVKTPEIRILYRVQTICVCDRGIYQLS